ncbi:MAG: PqqD family protein [Prevotella sp.]|nr:PqqD family protein [Prevotella sp.]MDY5667470.1 PqqD family protein [Alloprevotella sp.]
MKFKPGFELRDICGEKVVIATGIENIDFNQMIALNESAAYLWQQVADKEFNADTLTQLLCQEYEVDEATAQTDAENLISEWTKQGLI